MYREKRIPDSQGEKGEADEEEEKKLQDGLIPKREQTKQRRGNSYLYMVKVRMKLGLSTTRWWFWRCREICDGVRSSVEKGPSPSKWEGVPALDMSCVGAVSDQILSSDLG